MKHIKIFTIAFLVVNFIFSTSLGTKDEYKPQLNGKLPSKTRNINNISESHYKSMYNGKVKIFNLKRNGRNIGNSLWLYRTGKNIKAKYFAYKQNGQSIYERYNDWKKGKKIISYCAGPYTTRDYSKPQGLTIDNGNIVNRNIDEKLDGLIIVEAVGGVRVVDLEKPSSECINLVSIGRSLNPRNSSVEKNQFINWARYESATVFQTNLMYMKNDKKFGNVYETARRRIFVLAYHGGEVVHIIFNITIDVSLTDISKEIYSYLNRKNVRVIGILNFDTGSYDIFQVFNQNGYEDNHLHGTVSVRKAQNLMVYYYD